MLIVAIVLADLTLRRSSFTSQVNVVSHSGSPLDLEACIFFVFGISGMSVVSMFLL